MIELGENRNALPVLPSRIDTEVDPAALTVLADLPAAGGVGAPPGWVGGGGGVALGSVVPVLGEGWGAGGGAGACGATACSAPGSEAGTGVWAPTSVAGIARLIINTPTPIRRVLSGCAVPLAVALTAPAGTDDETYGGATHPSIRGPAESGSIARGGEQLAVGSDLAQDPLQARLA